MIHIIVGDEAAKNLEAAFELDENLRGEILVLKDTLGIGPIATDEKGHDGIRTDFWRGMLGEDFEGTMDKHYVQKIKETAQEEEEPVCLWLAPCVSDVSAYFFLLDQFKDAPGMFHIINIDSLPFFNEKGTLFYPKNFSEVLPKEFVKTKRLLKEVTPADYETESETWEQLQTANAMVRVYKGGKELENADETYFDNAIYNVITKNAQRGSKIIRQAQGKITQGVSDIFLQSRLAQMVSNGQIICDEENPKHIEKANYKKAGGNNQDAESSEDETVERE